MKIEEIEIEALRPYYRNPRKNSRAVEVVETSIREFGFRQPIVVDKENTIIVGHTRYQAAQNLKLKTVPVIVAAELSKEKCQAYRLMDNKSSEYSEWDYDKLIEEIGELDGVVDLMITGFAQDDIDYLRDEGMKTPEERENHVPEERRNPRSEPGDIWIMGEHRLICGSSTDEATWRALMLEDTARLVFTSPPYNMGGGSTLYEEYRDNKASEEYIEFNLTVVDLAKQYLKGFLFWNISYNANSRFEFIDILYHMKRQLRFLELIVWRKQTFIPAGPVTHILTREYEDIAVYATDDSVEDIEFFSINTTEKDIGFNRKTRHKLTNFWDIGNKNVQEKNHRAAFPVELPGTALRLMTQKSDIVIDPFGGTGTTLIAAEKYQRRARLIELSPVYCDLIVERWQDYTGGEAVRYQDGEKFNDRT